MWFNFWSRVDAIEWGARSWGRPSPSVAIYYGFLATPRQETGQATSGHDRSFPFMAASRDPFAAKRLDSWKEIAAFFGRAERTVKRWETERGLPIHRLPGGGRSAVFAYADELSDWLKSRKQELETEPAAAVEIEESERTAPADLPVVSQALPPTDFVPAPSAPSSGGGSHRSARLAAWLVPLFLAGSLIVLFSASHGGSRFKALAGRHSSNAEAQDLYLKGRYYWNRRNPEDITRAIDYFTQAIVKDPGDAQAYVGLADCYNLLREFGAMPFAEAYPRALAAAQRAVELDDTSAEAHNSLAFVTFWWTWHGATAEKEFKRALELDPKLTQAHHWYGTYLMAVHRNAEALQQLEEAQHLEPSSTAILADKGVLLWYMGRRKEGLALLKQLETSEPAFSSTHIYLGAIYSDQGAYPNAFAEWKQAAELRHDDAGLAVVEARMQGFASGGLKGSFENELPLQKDAVDQGGGSAYDLARTYAALGNKQDALAYLQIAFQRRDGAFISDGNPIPLLQDEPEYRDVRAQMAQLLSQ